MQACVSRFRERGVRAEGWIVSLRLNQFALRRQWQAREIVQGANVAGRDAGSLQLGGVEAVAPIDLIEHRAQLLQLQRLELCARHRLGGLIEVCHAVFLFSLTAAVISVV